MAVWTVYLSLCLLVALSASVETTPVGNKHCGVCQEGWSAFGCRCFKFFNHRLLWSQAEKICLEFGGNLASVHSHGERTFIQKLITKENSGVWIWIGGLDAVEEGVWLWSDGTKMNFRAWGSGQPDNYNGNQHCLMMIYEYSHWCDGTCTEKKPFVCAK